MPLIFKIHYVLSKTFNAFHYTLPHWAEMIYNTWMEMHHCNI